MMTSTNKNCAVLHCESESSADVEFFDFPQPNDPRYGIWIERTLQGSQWTPSSTSTICSRHFRAADVLTTEAADDSGRTEKRLKYDALPCVFECVPESERPQASYVPRPDSPEIIYQASKQIGSRAAVAAGDVNTYAGLPTIDVASLLTCPVDADPNVCCVPGCPSRRHQGVLLRGAPAVRFHAFPTDERLHWEWTKRVRCSVSWQPGPSAVVCSAHFVPTDYELSRVSGMVFLKSTAIPRQLACVGVFMMRKMESSGPSDRMCAICGCWRTRIQKHYKAAARLAFVPFPTDPEEREKWNALCKDISRDDNLFACENHFLLNEIASRFQESGEEKFTVRSGVVPRVEPTLWLDSESSPSEKQIPRASAGEGVCSTANQDEIPVQGQGTVNSTPAGSRLIVLLHNGIATPTVQLRSVLGKLAVARNVESAVIATEVCCVPGCSVKASNAGEKGVSMFRFISRANSRYTTWIDRIRCAGTWGEKHPLAICSKHFMQENLDPVTQTLLPNALPSQLSCISAFHFSGLQEGETYVTGMQICVVCDAKRKPGSPKSSEWLKFFPLPADPVVRAAWCRFVSAETVGQNVDTDTLICENHFLPADFTDGVETLKPSAVPSCTFRIQPEFRPFAYIRIPLLKGNTASNVSGTQPVGLTENLTRSHCQCCVSGCQTDWITDREKDVTFFKFVAADDPRYETWLERVRPDHDWIPDSTSMLCSAHFLPSQIILRVMRGATKRTLSKTALPSLLNGECRWRPSELEVEPADELKRFGYDCCMPGCENKQGRLGSEEVKFFRFVAADDPRYDTWLHRVRPDNAWVPDINTRICNAHFLPNQVKLWKNGNRKILAVLSSSALPSLVNGETKWEPSDIKRYRATRAPRNVDAEQERRINDTKRFSRECCVVGCGNVRGQQEVKFFRFPTRNDPRYNIWLERVRPNDSWIPDSETRICSEHFLSSQAERQKSGHYEWTALNFKALPSLLNGECVWKPNELLDGQLIPRRHQLIQRKYSCCVAGCGNRRSQKVSLFRFIKPDDPRYETWIQRVKPETDWIPNADSRICSEHFLPCQIKTHKGKERTGMRLIRTALPSRSDGKTMWEPADFRLVTKDKMESNATRRFLHNCCVPGCGNVRNRIGSKKVLFSKFSGPEEVRYSTWLRRLRYNSVWTPKPGARVCSEHFLESDFRKQMHYGVMRNFLRSMAVPSQLSCITTLCGFTESDMISGKIGCVVCGLIPSSANRELKPSERLQFYPCPVGEIKAKWIDFIGSQAAQVDSRGLAENASWFVCENHFVPESFEPQTENVKESRCLLADAVPSVPFTLELDYIDPRLKVIEKGSEPAQSDGTVAKKAKRRKEVNELSLLPRYLCCVAGCGNRCSQTVSLFNFVKPEDPRYEKWLQRVRPEIDWIPNGHTRICSEHFLPSQIRTHKGRNKTVMRLSRTALPRPGKTVWEPPDFPTVTEEEMDLNGTRRFVCNCCVPGCRNVRNRIWSKNVSFFKFIAPEDVRYDTWLRRLRYNSVWVPKPWASVCSEHFLVSDFKGQNQRGLSKQHLTNIAVPSQLSCMTTLCGFTDSDMISGKVGCVVCGLIPLSINKKLKPSEQLQFFRCPVGEMKTKWIDFTRSQRTQIDSERLAEDVSWFVCENHFAPQSFEPQAENMNEARCLLADAVPSVQFTLKVDYVDPKLTLIINGNESVQPDGTLAKKTNRKNEVDESSTLYPNSGTYVCVVPGCPLSSRIACRSSSERVTFHIFPSRSSARFSEWMKRIRCAVSWSPNQHECICNLHFLSGDFVEETSKGKQPKTRQIKKTTVPSQLQCVEKFRSRQGMDSVHDEGIQTCCICGCWRSVEKGSHCQRSERLTFFPFPVDDDQREMWVEVCRESHPDFRLSEESVVCENHFQQDDLICVFKDKKTTKLVLESNAVPSGRNFAWGKSGCDEAISDNYLCDAPDVDMEETTHDSMEDINETDYDYSVDTHLEKVSFMDENQVLPSSVIKWQMAPENGLPEDDAGDTFMDSMHLMADLPSALPSSLDDKPTESSQPLLAANGALIYCATCQVFLQTPCWLHSNAIPDEPVISLAVGSLPIVLYMDVCDDSPNGKAVFAKDSIPRHTVFGPLVAPLTAEEDASAQYFTVAEAGVGSRRKHYGFESDYACNWMKYVRFADSMEASNLLVFARGLEIVFVTSRTLSSHEELRVWYSAQYMEVIMDVKPFIPDLHPEREGTGDKADAVEFMDIMDDGASLYDLEGDDRDMSNTSFQNLPVAILPANTVSALPETLHSDLDIMMSQTVSRKKRGREWRDNTSCYLNRNICYECSTRFRLSDMLELHKHSHSQSESVTTERPERQCPECRKEYPAFDELLRHVNEHGTKIVPCPVCNDLCTTTTLKIHVKRYHPEHATGKRIVCLDCHGCSLRFTNASLYRMHKHKHAAPQETENMRFPEKCPECKAVFQEVDSLMEHVAEHGKSISKCPVCEEWYGDLRSHIVYRHPAYPIPPVLRVPALEVERTGKRMKTLFDSRTCHECCLRFPTNLLCQLHKCKHGNEEFVKDLQFPQKCPACAELFADLGKLVKHVDDHGRSIGKCPVCRHWFASLSQHIRRVHPAYHSQHGSQRRKCPVCDHWVGSLAGHLRRNHPGHEYLADPPSGECFSRDGQQASKTANTKGHRLTCYECRLRFPTKLLLQFHRSKHDTSDCADWPEKCPECDVCFDEIDCPLDHVDSHAKRLRKCHLCHQWRFYLTMHMRHSHPEYHGPLTTNRNWESTHTLACPDCGLHFATDFLRRIHATKHGREEYILNMTFPAKCPDCDKVFEERDTLVEHVDTHGKLSKKCPVCGECLADLNKHLRRNHPEHHLTPVCSKRPLLNSTCHMCGIRFPTENLRHLHSFQHITVENQEESQGSNECPQCDRVFQELNELAQHVDVHGKALGKCPVCELWFGQLTTHMRNCHPDYSTNWNCRDCGLRFQTHALYQLHKYKHENPDGVELPQKCPQCGEAFAAFDSLMDHVEQHGKHLDKCPVCHQWYAALKEHMRLYHPASKLDSCAGRRRSLRKRSKRLQHFRRLTKRPKTVDSTCHYCGVCFPAAALCKLHTYKHGRKEYAESLQFPQECPECCEVFEKLHDLVEHVEKHGERVENRTVRDESLTESETETCDDDDSVSREDANDNNQYSHKGHECPECGKEFRLRIGLQAHSKTCRRRIKCVICSEIFESKSDFDQHVASHQTDGGFLCGICLERFSFYRLLVAHVEKHGSQNLGDISSQSSSPFKCVLCHNGFASSDELNKHVKGHEGRDGFTCEICSEKFPFYRLLARHVSDEHRPADASAGYSCSICDSAFSGQSDLEIHLFTHDAELQFVCEQPHCGKRFVSMKSLQGHVSGFHKKRGASRHKPLQTKRKKRW